MNTQKASLNRTTLTNEQISRLILLAMEKSIDHCIILLTALQTGVSLTQLLKIRWKDIDFEGKTLMIDTRNGDRIKIIVGSTLLSLLEKQFSLLNSNLINPHEEHIFNKLSRHHVVNFIKSYLQSININRGGFSILKRTFIEKSLNFGISPIELLPLMMVSRSPNSTIRYIMPKERLDLQNLSGG